MMGKGAEGGITGNSCNVNGSMTLFPLSKHLSHYHTTNRMKGASGHVGKGVDIYSQVFKTLAVKPSHGEAGGVTGSLSVLSSTENKRKQKLKRNDIPGSNTLENVCNKDFSCGSFWSKIEDYFRDLTPDDIKLLMPSTKLAVLDPCDSIDTVLQMPFGWTSESGKEHLHQENDENTLMFCENKSIPVHIKSSQIWSVLMNGNNDGKDIKLQEHQLRNTKRKVPTASIAPKRRKLAGSTSGMITAVISPPENGDDELCHVCYGGDSDGQNQILFCDSCNVAVHQDCYGIKVVPEGEWLCSFCRLRMEESESDDSPDCVLCPVKGGALKLVCNGKEQSNTILSKARFCHLFCCQWIPETLIGDMEKMEPIMNIDEVRDVRWKLLCCICKEKHGACIQCSHGMCKTSFHPLCARQARLRMEVFSKKGGQELELRAFCSKHSTQNGKPPPSAPSKSGSEQGSSSQIVSNTGNEKLDEACCDDKRLRRTSKNAKDNKHIVVNGNIKVYSDSSKLADVDMKCLLKNFMEQNHISMNDIALQIGVSNDILSVWLQGKDLLTKEAHNKIQEWIILHGNSINGQVPNQGGCGDPKSVELKETEGCNGRGGTFKTYHTKRRKLEQLALPSTQSFMEDPEHLEKDVQTAASRNENHVCSSEIAQLDKSTLEPISAPRNKLTFRPDDAADLKMHPFILHQLVGYQKEIAERNIEDSLCGQSSTSPSSNGIQDLKLTRSKKHQPKGTSFKSDRVTTFSNNAIDESLEAQVMQLEHAKKLGILDMAPENELDDEILYLQASLLSCAKENQCRCEQLILKIIPSLAKDLRASFRREKDLSAANNYVSMVKEAKKQGRKEKRNKEAQAVLAAANAVAAASSRVGSVRKDVAVSYTSDEKPCSVRESFCTPSVPVGSRFYGVNGIARPGIPKLNYGQPSSSQTSSCGLTSSCGNEKKVMDSMKYTSELSSGESKEEITLCDVCKDPSNSNAVTTCKRCKVFVHNECYPFGGILTGSWHCQPCSEIVCQNQGIKDTEVTDRATPGYGVRCTLCLQYSGAFRRSFERNWVHVFCYQWIRGESASEKDGIGSAEELKLVTFDKVLQECAICHSNQGSRLRCSFGHCHGSFHPSCARDSGLYMIIKRASGGRTQYRAYCEKHSTQQRQKDDFKRTGSSDELSALLKLRGELERVRILCERVCKRERIKREALLCNMDLYTARLSSLASSSSDILSATSNTHAAPSLLKDHIETLPPKASRPESESYSWNSSVGEPISLSGDSAHQNRGRETPSRSQITDTVVAQERIGTANNGGIRKPRKNSKAETLHTEVLMTPTEASVQNQRLPKGYAYVPVGMLPKGKLKVSESSEVTDL